MVIMLLVWVNCSNAQLVTFNKTYGEYQLLETGSTGLEIFGHGFVMILPVFDLSLQKSWIPLLKVNYNGDTILFKNYGDSSFANNAYYLKSIRNNNLVFINNKRPWAVSNVQAIIYFLNSNLDSISGNNISSSLPRTVLVDFCQLQSGELIFTGHAQDVIGNTLQQSQLYIVKTDSMGNKLWDTLVGNNVDWEEGRSVMELSDSSFIVTGYTYKVQQGKKESFLYKFDKNGKLIKSKTKSNVFGLTFDSAILSKSNHIIIGGEKVVGMGPPIDIDGFVAKYDTALNLIWENTVSTGSLGDVFFNICELDNYQLVACGATNNLGQNKQVGWFARFDSAGTVIHERGWPAVPMYHDVSNFNSVIQASDGGTVLFGWAAVYDTAFGGYSQDAWIVKLDSNGCDIDTCPNIVSNASIPNIVLSNGNYIRTAPNPTGGVFTVSPTIKIEQIEIYNTTGQAVNFTKQENEIDITALPAGLYFVKITTGTKSYFTKVVRE